MLFETHRSRKQVVKSIPSKTGLGHERFMAARSGLAGTRVEGRVAVSSKGETKSAEVAARVRRRLPPHLPVRGPERSSRPLDRWPTIPSAGYMYDSTDLLCDRDP